MKFLFVFIIGAFTLVAQNAASYLPAVPGNVWKYQNVVLDSLGNPVQGSEFESVDSISAIREFKEKETVFFETKVGGFVTDTSYFAMENSDVLSFLQLSGLPDSLITFEIPEWITLFRFNVPNNTTWQIFRYDTLIVINNTPTNIRIVVEGRKIGNENITVPAGNFNAMKTTISVRVGTVVFNIFFPILTIPVHFYTALDTWIVKYEQPPVNSSNIFFDLTLPGMLQELTEFVPWENSPPVFVTTPDTVAYVDSLYFYQVEITDVDLSLGDTVIVNLVEAPEWLQFDEEALILSGSPTDIDTGKAIVIIEAIDLFGGTTVQEFNIEVMKITGIDNDLIVSEFILYQNYPNPFNPTTVISYQLPAFSNVTLKVYDILGNEVATLINEPKEAGFYEVELDASALSSGVYFYILRTNEFISSKKMVLLK